MSEMKLSLKDFGPIDEANIDLGKITVIGGENATGKSTTSKILYCFLRANSSKRQEITYGYIVNSIKDTTRDIQRYLRDQENCKIEFRDLQTKLTQYETQIRISQHKTGLEIINEIYNDIKDRIDEQIISDDSINEINEKFYEIDKLIDIVLENDTQLYTSIMKRLLKAEFSTADFNGIFNISGINENNGNFDFNIDFNDNDLSSDEVFKSEGWFSLNDIYYIDSFSILDLDQNLGLNDSEHAIFLTNNLKKEADASDELFDDKRNEDIIELENEINKIIKGEFIYDNGELTYVNNNGEKCRMKNTASGIKQVGIIQLLLNNRKLTKNSFLVIDEPEVNLHPAWQVTFAGVLALLVKKLNISLYINSHSPVFIEAIDAWAYYYDLTDDIKYYLSKKSGKKEGFNNIFEVDSEELYMIYDNLGKPYEDIDEIRIKKSYEI